MLDTPTIREFEVGLPGVFAFRVNGEVPKDDMEAMAHRMNEAFDEREAVDMLLVFEEEDGATLGARFDLDVQKAQFRSLSKVRHYLVVGASERARHMLEVMEKILPVDGKTFDTEAEALAFLEREAPPG